MCVWRRCGRLPQAVDGLVTTLDDQAGAGLPLVALVLVGAYTLFLLLTALPTVLAPPERSVAAFALVDPDERGARTT